MYGFAPTSLMGSAVGFMGNSAPVTAADLIGSDYCDAAVSTLACPSASWLAAQPDTLCGVPTCVTACSTLSFFCKMESNNAKWLEAKPAWTQLGKNFGHWRQEVTWALNQ